MNDKRAMATRRRDHVAADADAERLAERKRKRASRRKAAHRRGRKTKS